MPTLHTMFGIPAEAGSYPHHPTFASAAGTDDAHKEAVIVGKSLAMIGWDMLHDQGMYETARGQWQGVIKDE